MPTFDEIKAALAQIRDFCAEYNGKHQEDVDALRQRIDRPQHDLGENYEVFLRRQYDDAIGTLLLIVSPPDERSLKKTLSRLSSACEHNEPIVDVLIVDAIPSRDSAGEDAGRNQRPVQRISQELGRPQKLSKANQAVIERFKADRPRRNWPNPPPERG